MRGRRSFRVKRERPETPTPPAPRSRTRAQEYQRLYESLLGNFLEAQVTDTACSLLSRLLARSLALSLSWSLGLSPSRSLALLPGRSLALSVSRSCALLLAVGGDGGGGCRLTRWCVRQGAERGDVHGRVPARGRPQARELARRDDRQGEQARAATTLSWLVSLGRGDRQGGRASAELAERTSSQHRASPRRLVMDGRRAL